VYVSCGGLSRPVVRLGSLRSPPAFVRYAAVRPPGLDLALTLVSNGLDAFSRRRAMDALVRSRAAVLDEMATRHRAASGAADPEVARLAENLSRARERLASLVVRGPSGQDPAVYREMVEEAQEEKEKAERLLAEASTTFARELSRSRFGLDEVAASLPAGSALVAFVEFLRIDLAAGRAATERRDVPSFLAFVLHGEERDPGVIDLGPVSALDAAVVRWKQEAGKAPPRDAGSRARAEAAYAAAGSSLREKVWDPFAATLRGIDRVFVVPDGALNVVSFATLPAREGGYLVEGGPVVHYASAERDLVPADPARRGGGLLAVGGASYDATSLFASLRKTGEPLTPPLPKGERRTAGTGRAGPP